MKYLIVSGDSFTCSDYRSSAHPELDTSWPMWPEILGKKLGMKVVNLANSGKGNEFIYSSLQDYISTMPDKSEIGLVIAAWSQCQRRDYQIQEEWWDNRTDSVGDILYWVKRSLRAFTSFENMCLRYNIPYAHTQMIDLYKNYLEGGIGGRYSGDGVLYDGDIIKDEGKIIRMILKHEDIIDTSKFIGWPLTTSVGGYPLNRMVFGEKLGADTPWIISKLDEHPNAAGQVKIAEYLYTYVL